MKLRQALRMPEVEKASGYKRSTIYSKIQEQSFPPPRKIGNISVWWDDEVALWQRGLWRPGNSQAA